MQETTEWDLIESASRGDAANRAIFADRYTAFVRTLLSQRWRTQTLRAQLDDAVQDVFLECFKTNGALVQLMQRERRPFRPFLHGIVNNVALQHESRILPPRRVANAPSDVAAQVPDRGTTPSQLMDSGLAQSMVRLAAERMAVRAEAIGEGARRRIEILRLRFQEGQPIRTVAERLGLDRDYCHHQYAKARSEFGKALREVVAERWPGPPEAIEAACRGLLDLLK